MFRVLFSILALLLTSLITQAQLAKPIQFREEVYDFGTIAEDGGPVQHDFAFTNTSGRALKILKVEPSCGCTTPDWSKEAVPSGKTGFIKASFDPKSRPGFFTKTLTVTTDVDATPIVLQIKGTVNAATPAEALNDFSAVFGSWKLKSTALHVGKVISKDEWTSRDFQVVNAGNKPVIYTKFVGPAYIKVDMTPKVLAPGAIGNIKLSYNGKLRNAYGFQSDNVELHTDDELSPVKSFSVYATIEDDFSKLTTDELTKSPQIRTASSELDFGRITQGASSVRELSVTNAGRKELQIKSLQGNCNCVVAKATKETLKPGETTTIKVTFTAERSGTLQKALTIYSNDPQNPVLRIWIRGFGY